MSMESKNPSPEQLDTTKKNESPSDILAFTKEEGHALTDDELNQISGGSWSGNKEKRSTNPKCSYCGSDRVEPQGMHSYRCSSCQKVFTL